MFYIFRKVQISEWIAALYFYNKTETIRFGNKKYFVKVKINPYQNADEVFCMHLLNKNEYNKCITKMM